MSAQPHDVVVVGGGIVGMATAMALLRRAPRTLFLSVAAGTVRVDGGGKTLTLNAGNSRTFGAEPDRPPPGVAADAQVMDGYLHSVDLKAGSFVLGGKNESQTTFRFGVKTGERRADCLLLLDGKTANPATALKPGRKATVTYVKVGDDLGASKLEVMSAAK